MTRQQFLLMTAIFALFALTINTYSVQIKKARQDLTDTRRMEQESEQYRVQLMNITMYAPLSAGAVQGLDFSGDPSRSASGEKVVPGETAAAGANIPFGTRIYVEGLGWRTVNDRGSAIGPNDIDLVVDTREEAIKFGKQQRLVILEAP